LPGGGEPAAGAVGEGDERQHDRHFDQHAHDRDQRRARIEPEEADRHRHRELEEIRRANQRARRRHIVGHAPEIGRAVADREDAVGLDQQRHGDERDQRRLIEDHAALEPEQQHDRGE
jgi:hypothetical protein